MSPGGDRGHEWTLARLGAWAAGLLDDADAQALEAHLATCESCRSAADEVRRPEFPEDSFGQHLPASLLASWDESAPRLRGMLRTLARQHLERCALCRSELETLGFRAELQWDPEMEEAATPRAAGPERGRVFRWQPRLAAWWAAGIAAAAAAILVVMQTGIWKTLENGAIATRPDTTGARTQIAARPAPTPQSGDSSRGQPRGGPGSTGSAPAAQLLLALGPVSTGALGFAEEVRGGSASARSVPEVALDSSGARASFQLPAGLALLPDESRIEIAVVDSSGRTLRSIRASMSELYPADARRELVLRQGEPHLAPGRYTLVFRIRTDASGQTEERKYGFVVR